MRSDMAIEIKEVFVRLYSDIFWRAKEWVF
jgi:hypothetical protein